jgi:hypothetical protein
MTLPQACARFRDAAPELALGVLDGDERADALAHLATCVDCRAYTDQLAEIGDALLLLAPPADPPLGFESRLAARLSSVRPRRGRWLRPVGLAAAAAILAAILTAAVLSPNDHGDMVTATLASSRSGENVGHVWAYDGDRDWMFMTIENPWAADNPYICEAVLRDGRTVRLGRFQAHDGNGAWGQPIDVSVHDVRTVRVRTPDGTVVATATLG